MPGWLPDDWLTPVSTPDAACAALRAESETSVLDPVGIRRLWWRDVHGLLMLVVLVLMIVFTVQYVRGDSDCRSGGSW